MPTEARRQESRESFAALPDEDQAAVIEFLKTLQVPPEDAGRAGEDGSFGTPVVWAAVGGGVVGSCCHAGLRVGVRVVEERSEGLEGIQVL